jgi:hypothetical protein
MTWYPVIGYPDGTASFSLNMPICFDELIVHGDYSYFETDCKKKTNDSTAEHDSLYQLQLLYNDFHDKVKKQKAESQEFERNIINSAKETWWGVLEMVPDHPSLGQRAYLYTAGIFARHGIVGAKHTPTDMPFFDMLSKLERHLEARNPWERIQDIWVNTAARRINDDCCVARYVMSRCLV